MSTYRYLLGNTSKLYGSNVVFKPTADSVTFGEDVVVFDTYSNSYKALKMSTYDANTFNSDRYLTNNDVIIGITDGVVHAVAPDDAYGYDGMVNDDTAAAPCYYRIEIDRTKAGSFHYNLFSTDRQEGDVSWNAGDSLDSILSQITVPLYSSKAVLTDGKGIGISLGGYLSNTCTITNITGTVTVVDMSKFAVYNQNVKKGDQYNSSLPVINSDFKNWRGVQPQSILGSTIIPIGANTSCVCNTGFNYSYRSGANFSGWKSWASTNGSGSFVSDGVNGTTNNSAGNVMSKTGFDNNVNSSADASTNQGKMYSYYNNLLNSSTADFKYLHDKYVSWYGNMNDLYDAYLMSHMVQTDEPTSGIVFTGLNLGRRLTLAKGKVMTVDYNYKYYPAYPPEYNALQYGNSSIEAFSPGKYSHPEVYDLGLMFRDDLMSKCNDTWNTLKPTKKTALSNSMYIGSCVEFNGYRTWFFGGSARCFYADGRYYGFFRSRPVLAFEIF